MKQGQDITANFPGIFIIHQKIRGNTVDHHRHEDHELFLPLQGEIQIHAEKAALKAGPGKMIYLPPQTPHSFRSDLTSQGERLILMIEATAWKKHQGGTFGPSAISASQLCKEILFQLLIHPKTKASKALIETLIQTISEMLEAAPQRDANPLHFTGQAKDPRIKTALALLEENFHRSFSIEEIARKSGLSTRSFNRLFLTELAVTPKQAMTLYRVERAKQLLRQGKGSVTDIAFEVGYQSVSQFIATFRRHTGQLPSSLLR